MATRWATIRDVAKLAGVSVSTASKAFNNKDAVAEATRRRVLEAAKELNFTPNALIRSLQRGNTNTIGVFTWPVNVNLTFTITMNLLKGIADGIAATHHDLLLYSRFPGRDTNFPVTTFLDGRVDGVVLGPDALSCEGIASMAGTGLPAVLLYQGDVPETMGSVGIDNVKGVCEAIDYLVALGHRRIAFYAPLYAFDFQQRLEGYRQGLERNGIPLDPGLCATAEGYFGDLTPLCTEWLALPDPPTALIAGNDEVALRWFDELNAHGARVPDDISLIGFDDSQGAALMAPGLTTVRQPAELVGRTAAMFVDKLVDGALAETCRTVLPVELVLRGSTAPPPLVAATKR